MNYKYQFRYRGTDYYGKSIDGIANAINKDFPDMEFSSIVLMVNDNLKPVKKQLPDDSKPARVAKSKINFKEAVNGALSILKQASGKTVSQQEIERRGAICAYCPKAVQTSDCMSCGAGERIGNYINKIKQFFGGGVRIPDPVKNYYCDVCSCALANMLPAKLDDFDLKTRVNQNRATNCWLRPENAHKEVQ